MTQENQENAEAKNEEAPAPKLRFTVGEDYFFINVDFKKGEGSFFPLFQPWNGDTVTKIEIVKLHCAEHHRVRWDCDENDAEPKYDGFVFTDDTDMRWYNQYPSASYGQLDDSANWIATRSKPLGDDDPWYNYTQVEVYLRRLGDGVKHFIREDSTASEEEMKTRVVAAEGLQAHFDEIVALLKEQFGMSVKTEPYSFQVIDKETGALSTHVVENRIKVTLFKEEEEKSDTLTDEEYQARKAQLEASVKVEPHITRSTMFDMQVCVPKEWTDEQVKTFAETANPSGTEHGWSIRKEGHEALNGDPERVQCTKHEAHCHIMLDC